jgi:hypothetical protein
MQPEITGINTRIDNGSTQPPIQCEEQIPFVRRLS